MRVNKAYNLALRHFAPYLGLFLAGCYLQSRLPRYWSLWYVALYLLAHGLISYGLGTVNKYSTSLDKLMELGIFVAASGWLIWEIV